MVRVLSLKVIGCRPGYIYVQYFLCTLSWPIHPNNNFLDNYCLSQCECVLEVDFAIDSVFKNDVEGYPESAPLNTCITNQYK